MTHHPSDRPAHMGESHIWVSTASPLFERCGRVGCRAMRRFSHGTWAEPEPQRKKRVKRTQVQQPGLWA